MKDLGAGAFFVFVGLVYGSIAWFGLPIGVALNMGPGYFPIVLSGMLIVLGLIGIILSWVSVAWTVGTLIYQKSKQSGMPQPVKELRWKMRNVDMTRDQILAEMAAAQTAVAPPPSRPSST